jgi:universal stress protein A
MSIARPVIHRRPCGRARRGAHTPRVAAYVDRAARVACSGCSLAGSRGNDCATRRDGSRRCDVATGTSHALRTSMGFAKILCPVDFSPGSREALRVAAELARGGSATLVLAHVWEPPRWSSGEIQLAPGTLQELLDAEEAELARWKAIAEELGARQVATQMLTGVAWDQIVGLASKDPAIDLIVMGTHGRTGITHVLLGSVAEKVVRHAPCAVLVTRMPDGSE